MVLIILLPFSAGYSADTLFELGMTLQEAEHVEYVPYDMEKNLWNVGIPENHHPHFMYQTTYAGYPAVGYVSFARDSLFVQSFEIHLEDNSPQSVKDALLHVRKDLISQYGPPLLKKTQPSLNLGQVIPMEKWIIKKNHSVYLDLTYDEQQSHLTVIYLN